MQPPVVRKQIIDTIRRRGEPTRIQDMEGTLKLPYGNIMQACTRAVAAGDLVKIGPGTFGLPGMKATNGFVSVPVDKRRASSGFRAVPRRQSTPASIAEWVSRQTRTD
jgi:hypothetical protein